MSKKRFGRKKAPKAPPKKSSRLTPRKGTRRDSNSRNGTSHTDEEDTSSEPHEAHTALGETGDVNDKPKLRGRGDSGELLLDEHKGTRHNDLRLVNMAVRRGWNVRRKTMIRRRLEDIVSKTEVTVMTKEGPALLEHPADVNAISAANVLAKLDMIDQKDIHKSMDKPVQPPQPDTININVSVDARRIELAKLAHKLGARELLINGEQVDAAEYLGTALPVPAESTSVGEVEPVQPS